VEFWDESAWARYFRDELGAFYAALTGFLEARQSVLERLSGDLAQVLRGSDRDLALQVLLGGVKQECVDRGVIDWDCFPEGSAARFFGNELGFGVNLNAVNKLVNALRAGKMPQELGVGVTEQETSIIKTLREIESILARVYRRVPVEVVPRRYEVRDARDLVKAYEEVLNAGLRLLPLYNPFTFFLYSLRLTPKPYLKVMYGERLFDSNVAALMEKYGVKIGLRVVPGLGKELDEELGLFGHEGNSVGDLVVRSIAMLYGIVGEREFEKYLNKYKIRKVLEDIGIYTSEFSVSIGGGVAYLTSEKKSMSYTDFLELFSPVLFLGLGKPLSSSWLDICLSSSCLFR